MYHACARVYVNVEVDVHVYVCVFCECGSTDENAFMENINKTVHYSAFKSTIAHHTHARHALGTRTGACGLRFAELSSFQASQV